jgi:N-acetylneuraminate synthase
MKILELFDKSSEDAFFPYIIAEAGVNHECSMSKAKLMIEEAFEGGANAIKFQTYRAETIASRDSPAYWDLTMEPTKSQYELFKKHDHFWKNEMADLKNYCDQVGIEFMSTPFDCESARFLNELMDVFKISSSDITNRPFIEYICDFGKPVILSTGASYIDEIKRAVGWIEKKGNSLALLHCILNYPTKDNNANLGMIKGLKKEFPHKIIGYSDHTTPQDMKVCEIAALLGAQIIEKHFTFDKSLPGNDHYHAMDIIDLKKFVSNLKGDFNIIGPIEVTSIPEEEPARQNARRSLVASRFIPEGKILDNDDLTFKRPASGISPDEIYSLIGKRAKRDIQSDEILQWSYFK